MPAWIYDRRTESEEMQKTDRARLRSSLSANNAVAAYYVSAILCRKCSQSAIHTKIFTLLFECAVTCLHWMIETVYWGSIAGSAIHSRMCSNMLLPNVDLKCPIHFFIIPRCTIPVFCYMDGKHAVSG